MPKPRDRSRSKRKVFVRVPSGKTKIRYLRKKKADKHYCAVCKNILQATHSKAKLSKTQKRPERLFGGHLCHKCTDKVITYAARLKEGIIAIDDIEIRYRSHVKQIK